MDNTPLSLLGCIEALDWLFVPGCELLVTDVVFEEATRDPGAGSGPRKSARRYIAGWFESNKSRISVVRTQEGERYEREHELWRAAGMPPALRPAWRDRGEASLLEAVKTLKRVLETGEEIIVLVDDRDARDAVRAIRADIMMLGTRTFVRWMAEDFSMPGADSAWQAILLATDTKADPGEDSDPVYVRTQD